MFDWLKKKGTALVAPTPIKYDPSAEVTKRIVEEFETGTITHVDLNLHSISELGCRVNNINIIATWYEGGFDGWRLRFIRVQGQSFLGSEKEAKAITAAAFNRSRGLLKEQLAGLHDRIFQIR